MHGREVPIPLWFSFNTCNPASNTPIRNINMKNIMKIYPIRKLSAALAFSAFPTLL